MYTKVCAKCAQEKPVEAYWQNNRTSDGLQSYCKSCSSSLRAEHKKRTEHVIKQQWLDKQQGKCALCSKDLVGMYDAKLDHDHNCEHCIEGCDLCFRGVLCNSCNTKLGWLENRLSAVLNYLGL